MVRQRPKLGSVCRQCGEYRSQVEDVRARLGDSARQGTFEWQDSMLVAVWEGK